MPHRCTKPELAASAAAWENATVPAATARASDTSRWIGRNPRLMGLPHRPVRRGAVARNTPEGPPRNHAAPGRPARPSEMPSHLGEPVHARDRADESYTSLHRLSRTSED